MQDRFKRYSSGPSSRPKNVSAEPVLSDDSGPVRLNRYLAQSGVAARRKADEWIAQGRVRVNGEVAQVGMQVKPTDLIEVDGAPIVRKDALYLLMNKPDDTITTCDDDRGRTTVLDLVRIPEARKASLFPVGRLDRHTTGALLLTNDGELAHRLMHPSYEVEKLYRVLTDRTIRAEDMAKLEKGIELEDGIAKVDQIAYVDPHDKRLIGLSLHEGRNRQIRRMIEALGYEVKSLERVSYAGLTTEGLRFGRWRALLPHEIARLRRMVKLK